MDRYTIFSYNGVESTNDKGWELLIQKRFRVPFVVHAKIQNSGRGRYGRKWVSKEGGLYFSIVENERLNNELIVCTTLALHDVLKKHGIDVRIVLPNDIYAEGGKIAGILIERRGAFTVNGIGINVNQHSFENIDRKATSMYIETRTIYGLRDLLDEVLAEYFHLGFLHVFERWREIVMRDNKHLKVLTRMFTGKYFLKEIDRELNLYFDGLPLGKKYVNLFDVIKIDTTNG